ncbi:hypothetical protein [Micromonospora sp. NPDC092111]|uniref:hypothetical protein n=1 Tax=Micromonospora sp. NPDC092111 TaxID=3364289 RepID=UPI0038112C84
MFLGVYHFDGDHAALLPAYDRLIAGLSPDTTITLQLCLATDRGISVYDACPSRESFRTFAAGADIRRAFAAAGLPEPHIEELGDVYRTTLSDVVRESR